MSLAHVQLTPQLVQAVRDAVDILPVAEEHTRLERRGSRYVGLCPLHKEKTPSFSVEPTQNLFYCFGCGAGGDAIKLHMSLTGDDFPGAIEALARKFGVPLPKRQERRAGGPDPTAALEAAAEWFCDQLAHHEEPRRYLAARGFESEIVERYGLGYAPSGWEGLRSALGARIPLRDLEAAGLLSPSRQPGGSPYDRFRHRLMFPIRTAGGRLVGFGGRTLGDDRAKYINTKETEAFRKGTLLYGLDQAKRAMRDEGRAVLVEGYFDVLGTVASGVEGVVASMGTALTADQARHLARYSEEVIVAYDGDEAGETAHRRSLPVLAAAGLAVRRAELGAGADPDSLRQEAGPQALRDRLEAAPDAFARELQRLIPADARNQPQTQARVATEVIELLTPLPDPILRFSYGRLAAERLGLPFELLVGRLRGQGRAAREARRGEPRAEATASRSPGYDQELGALRALFAWLATPSPTGLGDAEGPSWPVPEVFWDPACRNIFAAFRGLYGDGAVPSLSELIAALPADGTESALVARLVNDADEPEASESGPGPGERCGRALGQLRRRWQRRRRQELQREIGDAERAGDADRLSELVDERDALAREIHLSEESA